VKIFSKSVQYIFNSFLFSKLVATGSDDSVRQTISFGFLFSNNAAPGFLDILSNLSCFHYSLICTVECHMFGFSFEWRSVKIWYYGILEIDVDNLQEYHFHPNSISNNSSKT
jgi:hypothetical protein